MNTGVFYVLLVVTVIIVTYIIRQSNFKQCRTCMGSDVKVKAISLPYINTCELVNKIINNSKHQNGVKVTGYRATNKELCSYIPDICDYLQTDAFYDKIAEDIGFKPVHIEFFARLYTNGDEIDWHYDDNLTSGKRVTAVIQLDKSYDNTSNFEYRDELTGNIITPNLKNNEMVFYSGEHVFHRVTTQKGNGTRLVLVLACYETLKKNLIQKMLFACKTTVQKYIDF